MHSSRKCMGVSMEQQYDFHIRKSYQNYIKWHDTMIFSFQDNMNFANSKNTWILADMACEVKPTILS